MSVTLSQYAYLDQEFAGASNMRQYQPTSVSTPEIDGDRAVTDDKDMALFGDDGFGFDDFLDIINPLQHLPVISTLYREFTGDEISPGSRMIGGGVFGGGIGLAASVVNTVIEAETGKDVGGHVMAMFTGGEEGNDGSVLAATETETQLSQNSLAPNAEATIAAQEKIAAPSVTKAAHTNTGETHQLAPANIADGKPVLHMGLEWKGKAPDLHKNIQNAQSTQDKGLSEDQLSRILGSFKVGKVSKSSLPAVEAQPAAVSMDSQKAAAASKIYEKQAQSTAKQGLLISDSFSYMDRLI